MREEHYSIICIHVYVHIMSSLLYICIRNTSRAGIIKERRLRWCGLAEIIWPPLQITCPSNVVKCIEYTTIVCFVWGNVWGSDSPVNIIDHYYLLYYYVLLNQWTVRPRNNKLELESNHRCLQSLQNHIISNYMYNIYIVIQTSCELL